ncbi:MAG: septum formation initiator family protein, partial [Pseudomonadota bacterium]|nr:septum formation initiator family protein [Pseudomonadota bacterium]
MRLLSITLFFLLILIQFKLWFGEGSIREYFTLKETIESQKVRNESLIKRNNRMIQDIQNLKNDGKGIEEVARKELGMIKEGET